MTNKEKVLGLTELRYDLAQKLTEIMTPPHNKSIFPEPVSHILKCHLLTEVALEKLIKLAYHPNGDAVLAANLSYSKKLTIASKTILFDDFELLTEETVCSLKQLNSIRNRLSHELDATITKKEIVNLFMGNVPFTIPNVKEAETDELIYHYTPFIFGYMLPKYEEIDDNEFSQCT